MRRKDREITSFEDIIEILNNCEVIHLGLSSNDQPYVVPLNFGFTVEDSCPTIYVHSASSGKKIDLISKNPKVFFEAFCSNKIISGELAEDWTSHYRSIMGSGTAEILPKTEDKIFGLDRIMEHCGYKGELSSYSDNVLKAVTVIKITVSEFTGKANPGR